MLRRLKGLWLRFYNRWVPAYQYTGVMCQPNAEEYPYQTVGVGLSYQELNRKREELGDLPVDIRKDLEQQGITTKRALEIAAKQGAREQAQTMSGPVPMVAPTAGAGNDGSFPGIATPIEQGDE